MAGIYHKEHKKMILFSFLELTTHEKPTKCNLHWTVTLKECSDELEFRHL